MSKYLKLIRVTNWFKNVFVIAPLIFSLKLVEISSVWLSLLGFLSFCFISSSVYILNDLLDIEADKLHPRKKLRPLPAGIISKKNAFIVLILFLVLSVTIALSIGTDYIKIIILYFVLNILYSSWLKTINLIESFIIALFFVLRVLAGCNAINVTPSHWVIIITFCIALFLTFIKRKSEIISLNESAKHRKVLEMYSTGMLNIYIVICGTVTICSYILYTINDNVLSLFNTNLLVYSSTFVVLGIFRFIQLNNKRESYSEGDPTTLLFKDRFLQLNFLAYCVYIVGVLYINHN